jgi:hypothetical protein
MGGMRSARTPSTSGCYVRMRSNWERGWVASAATAGGRAGCARGVWGMARGRAVAGWRQCCLLHLQGRCEGVVVSLGSRRARHLHLGLRARHGTGPSPGLAAAGARHPISAHLTKASGRIMRLDDSSDRGPVCAPGGGERYRWPLSPPGAPASADAPPAAGVPTAAEEGSGDTVLELGRPKVVLANVLAVLASARWLARVLR